ncbi:MAG: hypothetical protein ACI9ZD_002879, partial [Paracoccaceae bacterium]
SIDHNTPLKTYPQTGGTCERLRLVLVVFSRLNVWLVRRNPVIPQKAVQSHSDFAEQCSSIWRRLDKALQCRIAH